MDDARYHTFLLEMFRDAEEATWRSREKAARDLDYYDGKQWTEHEVRELKRRGQPAITLNLIRNKIDYLQGMERTQRTKPRALPRTPADEDQAEAATDALRFVADQNDYDDKRSRVWGDLLKVGWGGYEITAEERAAASRDDMMGSTAMTPLSPYYDVKARRCQWDRMIWDPYSTEEDFSDASYRGMVVWMDRDQAIRKYGEAAGQVFDETVAAEQFNTYADKPHLETWVRHGTRRRVRIVQLYHVNPDDGEWNYCEFTRGGILQSGPSPWLDEDGRREHPYAWRSAYIDRDNNRYGAIRDMIDPQDEINKRRSKALHHFTARQTFGRQGSLGDKSVKDLRQELARPDGHVELAGNVEFGKDFGVIPTGDQAAGHMELLNQAGAVFETLGPNAAMQGKASGAPSGRALIASQQGGSIQLGTLTDALRQMDFDCFRKMWLRIKQFWTGETWIRVTDDMQNLKWVGLNKPKTDPMTGMPQIDPMTGQPALDNDVTGLDVDIIIDEAPNNGTLADEQFQMLVQLKTMDQQNEIPFSYIINAAPNLRNKQELVQATREREQQPPNPIEVAGAQAKVADAQAAAQLKQAQAARTAAEIPRVEADTARTVADTRRTVVDTHGKAQASVLDAMQAAAALQQPLVQTPQNFTVSAP